MGDLTIKILSGHNLIASDRNGKSDPYVTVEIIEDPTQRKQRTKTIHKNLNPIWNQAFLFKALSATNTILFKVWDHDTFSRDDPLGNVTLSISRLSPHSPNNLMLDLQGVQRGKLSVEVIYRPYQSTPMSSSSPYSMPSAYPPPQQNSVYPPPASSQQMNQSFIQQQPYSPYMTGSAPPMMGMGMSDNRAFSGPYPPPSPSNSAGIYPPPSSQQSGPYPPPMQQSGGVYPPPSPQQNGPYPPPMQQSGGVYPPPMQQSSGVYPPPMQQSGGGGVYPPPSQTSTGSSPFMLSGSQQSGVYPPSGGMAPFSQTIPPTPPTDPSLSAPISLVKPGRSNTQPNMNISMSSGYNSYGPPMQQNNPYPPPPMQQVGQYPPPPPMQSGPYAPPAAYGSMPVAYPHQPQAMVNSQGTVRLTKFFVDVRKRLQRDYIIIMDRSGSMSGARWRQAQQACMQLAPFACQADPDGITLYLFNDQYKRFNNLQTAQQVEQIFKKESPSGTTAMDKVIHAAFQEHFSTMKPTTILMITDGEPDSKAKVFDEIMKASARMTTQEQLSISFIQIGDDREATSFLQELDDSMVSRGARFDLVDTLSAKDIGKMSFDQLIQKSIYD